MLRERFALSRLPEELRGFGDPRTALLGRPRVPAGARLAPAPERVHAFGHLGMRPTEAFLRRLCGYRATHGDVVRLRFGGITGHLISDPELVRVVLQERHRLYSKATRGILKLRLVLGLGLLTAEGESWLRNRRIAQPAFARRRLEGFAERMAAAGEAMVAGWRDGEVLDAHGEMNAVTLRIVSETMFGADLGHLAGEVAAAVSVVTNDVNQRMRSLVELPLAVPTPQNQRFTKAMDTLDRIVLGLIQERRREPPGTRDDLLAMLMEARDVDTGEGMSDTQLRDEVMTIFLAGHETTANALSWTLLLLSRHPESARRLREEVDAVLAGGRTPTHEDVAKLPYATRVVQESMRLYPPAWMVSRAPTRDDELGGYFIPKGSLIFVSPFVVHRHVDHWPDPERFDPDRFFPDAVAARHRMAYFPFGGGPRLCIGQGFAMMEAVLLLAIMVRGWRLDLRPGHTVPLEPLITLRPEGGLPMTAVRR